MRPEPRFTPDAQADVAYAVDYYNAQRLDLGYEFLDEVERVTSLIRESPLLFTLVDPPIRRALLRRFPYGAFYVPSISDDADVVVAVVDLRQDPDVIRLAYGR
jgi:toxin ParE1/3/4